MRTTFFGLLSEAVFWTVALFAVIIALGEMYYQ